MSLYIPMTPAERAEIASWAKAASNGFAGDPKVLGALMFKCLRTMRIQDAKIQSLEAMRATETAEAA